MRVPVCMCVQCMSIVIFRQHLTFVCRFAQMHLNNLEKAKECYEKVIKDKNWQLFTHNVYSAVKAMQLDPGNESYSSSLGAVKLRLEAQRRKVGCC